MVDLKGEKKEQFNILLDINKINSYNLAIAQVMKQIESLNFNIPNISTNTNNNSLVVLEVKKAIENVKDLENLIISYNFQTPIYLKI